MSDNCAPSRERCEFYPTVTNRSQRSKALSSTTAFHFVCLELLNVTSEHQSDRITTKAPKRRLKKIESQSILFLVATDYLVTTQHMIGIQTNPDYSQWWHRYYCNINRGEGSQRVVIISTSKATLTEEYFCRSS